MFSFKAIDGDLVDALSDTFSAEVSTSAIRWETLSVDSIQDETMQTLCVDFAPARKLQFLAGRYCASAALNAQGIRGVSIFPGENREPVWPKGMCGSISHAGEWAASGVGPTQEGKVSLGLDFELSDRCRHKLWRLVLTQREVEWVRHADSETEVAVATAVFSAKETFYKWQYPLTESWLGFHDVETIPIGDSALVLKMTKADGPVGLRDRSFTIQIRYWGGYVISGMYE